jgi:hypothetical protein
MHRVNADLAQIAGNADKRQGTLMCHDVIAGFAQMKAKA